MKGNVGCAYLELIFVLDIPREHQVRFLGRDVDAIVDARFALLDEELIFLARHPEARRLISLTSFPRSLLFLS
jgi:hypothetical protein